MDLLRKTCRCCSMHGFRFCPAGVGGSLVDRHLQELRGVRDGCIGGASQEERLRLRLHELGLPLNGRRSDDISLRKLCQAMDISLQHPSGDRKGRDELVEALVSALLSEVPVLGNLHMSFVDACLKDLREVRDSGSGQAPQRDELEKRWCKFAIKDKRDHVVTLTDLCRSLELPIAKAGGGGMSKAEYVQQILTALLTELPATASVDDGKTALVDASLRELLAFRDSLTGQPSQRRQLESRLEQFNVRDRRSDAVTVVDLCTSLGLATKHAGRYFPKADLVGQIVSTLLRRVPAAASRDVPKASVDAFLQELRRVRDGVDERAARRRELEKCLDRIKMKDQGVDAVVLTDLCRSLELPVAKPGGGGMKKAELVEQIVAALLAELPAGASVDARKAAFVDASLQELRRVRDGVDEQPARRHELEKCLDKIKMKDQGPDAVVLTDLCRSLKLPVAKPGGGGMQRPALAEQIVAALLAELPAGASVGARKAAFVDASLQELRRVRDGVDEQPARRHELEKCLDKIKMKDQGPDAVGVTDLCHSLELPVAKPGGSWMKKAELVEQIISTLLKEVFVPCSDVDKSSFDMAMEICRSFDESRCDLDSAVRGVCNTVESCVCLGSVLMGIDEEELLRRHKGLDYWVEQLVQVLAGFLRYVRMLRNSLPSDVPSNLRVFPTDLVRDRSRDDGPCRGAKCLALGVAVEFCEEKKRSLWSTLFGTADKVELGSRFCLVLEYLAAEDDMAVDDDVACLIFVYRFMFT